MSSVFIFCLSEGECQILSLKSYNVSNGLPSNNIEAITQDYRGYMWFGTTDGISVFDGKIFYNYTMLDGLPGNFISEIVPDRRNPGTMWIIAGGTLCRYEDDKFTQINIDVNIVHTVYQDIYGVIWCGTDRGAFTISGNQVSPFYPLLLNKDVSGITEIGDSVIWFSNNFHITRYRRITKEFTRIEIGKKGQEEYSSMYSDNDGSLWVIRSLGSILHIRGSEIIQQRSNLFEERSKYYPTSIYSIEGDNLWLIGYNGISKISKSHFLTAPTVHYTVENGLPENTIRSAFVDREGILWIGGRDRGIAKLSEWNILRFPVGSVWYVHHHQFATADTNNHVWVIANEKLTEFWKDHYGMWHQYSHNIKRPDSLILQDLGGPRVFSSLFYDWRGRLWISSLQCPGIIECYEIIPGLSPDDGKPSILKLIKTVWVGKELENKQLRILCFLISKNDDLWVSIAGGGIAHYNIRGSKKLLHLFQDELNYIRTIYEDKNGVIWAGSFNNGLFKISKDELSSGVAHRFSVEDGLPGNSIWDVFEDRYGRRFVGTSNGGLVIMEHDSLRTLNVKNGLPSNKIYSIAQDSIGRLWLSTSIGVVYEDLPQSERFLARQPFTGSAAFCSGVTKNGVVWFVTAKDLFVYDYYNQTDDTMPPVVRMTGLRINGIEYQAKEALKLSYDKNNFEFNFIGISFKDENAVRYQYRMIGLDRTWLRPTHNNSIRYRNLEPGTYRFEVKSINVDGIESIKAASINIIIMSPFWRTWWFTGIVSFFILSGAVTFYRIKTNRIKKEQQVAHQFSRQLIDSQESERKRVSGELHDGLGQELMVIINRAQIGLKVTEMETIKSQLDAIHQTASHAIEDVREIAYNLSPYHLEQFGLMESVRSMVDKISGSVNIRFGTDITALDCVTDKNKGIAIYRIIQECLNNIVKHSGATEATFVTIRNESNLITTIHDNGKGFDVAAVTNVHGKRKGFGLVNLSERIKLLGGTLVINSSETEGTNVVITIPLSESEKQS